MRLKSRGIVVLQGYTGPVVFTGFILFILLAASCKKTQENGTSPMIWFRNDSGFFFRDTTLHVGQKITVGVEARSEESFITYFHIGWNDGVEYAMLDSGMNHPSLSYVRQIIKTASEKEVWTFEVMNRHRQFNRVSLTLLKTATTEYGDIVTYQDVLLGGQNNPSAGSFFSLAADRVYFLDEAFQRQDSIDLIYYFDQYDATLSSPNEADAPMIFTGPSGLSNWTVKNETRYDTTSISPGDFGLSVNDSLILAAYEPVNLKRKAKYVLPGMVLSFRDHTGNLGLILIKEGLPSAEGYIRMSIKIQK